MAPAPTPIMGFQTCGSCGARIISKNPARRVGRPEDIAEMAAFLLDRDRAGFVTGANFVVDGGMTRKMIYQEQPGRDRMCATSDNRCRRLPGNGSPSCGHGAS